uniref:CX domain-containing protein n=1 Tax=Toxocara canis TaxID=6265 RepID=A0A183U346_TOXCA
LERYQPQFNAMSIQCAEQVDGKLYATDVLVNVDTLIEVDRTNQLKEAECALRKGIRGSPCELATHAEPKEQSKNLLDWRYKLRDYGTIPEDFKGVEDRESNIAVAIRYGSWSCCTSCCCTAETCGQGYGLSADQWYVPLSVFIPIPPNIAYRS